MVNDEQLESRMDRVIEWVKACDNKASILLSVDALIITIMLAGDYCMNGFRTTMSTVFSNEYNSLSIWGILAVICLIVTIVLLIKSLYYCIKVVEAKTNENLTKQIGIYKESLIHFHHISQLSFEHFKKHLESESCEEHTLDLISQLYINAVRCNEKFDDYNKAIKNIKVAIPFAVGYIIFITLFLAKILPVVNG